ncbi:hypothetical protein DYI25_18080 [Mesobacillus boroniphilus]|uniref:Uncharacterized protein n=1 Tax=Mesobacillus boroniphilus TaxID=308892 RepID=A0A944GY47_9BACI|nr:hypothetical protein [Mesobacillus boroniphilus]MBS8266334.1 hypothetical protein [Mesobacillus boroniphilus]
MQFTEIVVFAIVWGGLMTYFLIPFDNKISIEGTFPKAFMVSLKKQVFHKKAILAFALLLVTLITIWSDFKSAVVYDILHGITRESAADPQEQAIFYMISVMIYAALLYLFLAVRWTVKAVKAAKID